MTSAGSKAASIMPTFWSQSMFSCHTDTSWDRKGASAVSMMGSSTSKLRRSTDSVKGKFSSSWLANRSPNASSGSACISAKPF